MEGQAGADRLHARDVLNAERLELVFDDQMRVGHVERQELACRQLMIQPVHGPVLQIRQRIVTRRAGQFVIAEHHLLLPGMEVIGGVG